MIEVNRIKQESLQLTGGGKKENRRGLDFYPTPPEATIALMEFLKLQKSRIWEPACGNGAMSKVIESYGHNVFSSDIAEECYGGNGKFDFLSNYIFTYYDAVITNPPFNKSAEFIERALKLAPCVAMLLKSQYWHAKKRIDLFENNPPAWILPLTWRPDFMNGEKGGAPTMEVAWTVWIKGEQITKYKPLRKPNGK